MTDADRSARTIRADIVAARLSGDESRALPHALAAVRAPSARARPRDPADAGATGGRPSRFLTEVGHASDERRQEWVLLSDLLGVTALVEEINCAAAERRHAQYRRAGRSTAPMRRSCRSAAIISLDGVGEPLDVSGRVRDLDGMPVAGATVETWQANGAGLLREPAARPAAGIQSARRFPTDGDGRFHYGTVKPAGYGVPDDGPVGQLLGRLGYPLRRPAHLHFLISAPASRR